MMSKRDGTEPPAQKKKKINPSVGAQSSSHCGSQSTTRDEEMESDDILFLFDKKSEREAQKKAKESEKKGKESEKKSSEGENVKRQLEETETRVKELEEQLGASKENEEKMKEDRDKFKTMFGKCCIEARSFELRAEFAEGSLEKMAAKGQDDPDSRKENIQLHMQVGELTRANIQLQKEMAERNVDGDKTMEPDDDKLKHLREEVEQLRNEKEEWNKEKMRNEKDEEERKKKEEDREKKIDELKADLKRVRKMRDANEDEMEHQKKKQQEKSKHVEELESNMRLLKMENDKWKDEWNRERMKNNKNELNGSKRDGSAEMTEMSKAMSNLESKLRERNAEKVKLMEERDEERKSNEKLESEVNELKSQLKKGYESRKDSVETKLESIPHKAKEDLIGLKKERNGAGSSTVSPSDVSAPRDPSHSNKSTRSNPIMLKASDLADEFEVLQIERDRWRDLLEEEMNLTQKLEAERDEAYRKLSTGEGCSSCAEWFSVVETLQGSLRASTERHDADTAYATKLRLSIFDLEKRVLQLATPQQFVQQQPGLAQPGLVQYPQLASVPGQRPTAPARPLQQQPLQPGVEQQHLQPLQHSQPASMQQPGQPPAAPARTVQQQPQRLQPPFSPFPLPPLPPPFPR